MTLNQFRRILYTTAKYTGDLQALTSKKKGAIERRLARRGLGYMLGRFMGWLIR